MTIAVVTQVPVVIVMCFVLEFLESFENLDFHGDHSTTTAPTIPTVHK